MADDMMENGAPLREGGRTMGEEMGEGEQEMMSKRCFDVRQDYGLEKKIITSFAQEGEETYIFGVDLSPSSNRCVTHDSNGKICVWDTSSLQVICEMSGHEGRINNSSFTRTDPENFVISSSDDASTRCWDTRSGKQTFRFYDRDDRVSFQGVDSTAAAPLVICSFGNSVAVFDIRKGSNLKNPVTTFEAHSDDVTQVKIRPGRPSEVVTAGSDGLINFFSLRDLSDSDECLVSALNADGEPLEKIGFIGGGAGKRGGEKLLLWSITANETIATFDVEEEMRISYWGTSLRSELTALSGIQTDYLVGCCPLGGGKMGGGEGGKYKLLTGNYSGEGVIWEVSREGMTPLSHLVGAGGVGGGAEGGHFSTVSSFAVCPKSGGILTVGDDSRMCKWKINSGWTGGNAGGAGKGNGNRGGNSSRSRYAKGDQRKKRASPY